MVKSVNTKGVTVLDKWSLISGSLHCKPLVFAVFYSSLHYALQCGEDEVQVYHQVRYFILKKIRRNAGFSCKISPKLRGHWQWAQCRASVDWSPHFEALVRGKTMHLFNTMGVRADLLNKAISCIVYELMQLSPFEHISYILTLT